MGLFNRRKSKNTKTQTPVTVAQTSSFNAHPFYDLNGYNAMNVNNRVYRSLRESVPIIDSAISKIVRLMGGFEIITGNNVVDSEIKNCLNNINVGGNQKGICAFIDTYMEQLLTYGTAVGEMIIDNGRLTALYNGELDVLEVKRKKNSIDLDFYNTSTGTPKLIENPQLLLFSVLNPEPGNVLGTSLLRGLPFISNILLTIYNTIGSNWERVGNLRYAVTYKPQGDGTDKAFAKERANQMASAWKEAMSSKESIKDFVAVGDVKVSVIGSDNQVLDSEVPVRQLLEQIIAKTGLMPYMFGLSWSSTERMSLQQADILTTELEAYRRIVTPIIEKIVRTFLCLNNIYLPFEVLWDDITLQDETQIAQARLYNAQAKNLEQEVENDG